VFIRVHLHPIHLNGTSTTFAAITSRSTLFDERQTPDAQSAQSA
jgi:hypothetical protein